MEAIYPNKSKANNNTLLNEDYHRATCNKNPTATAVAATRQNCRRAGMSVKEPTKKATTSHTAAPKIEGATCWHTTHGINKGTEENNMTEKGINNV